MLIGSIFSLTLSLSSYIAGTILVVDAVVYHVKGLLQQFLHVVEKVSLSMVSSSVSFSFKVVIIRLVEVDV